MCILFLINDDLYITETAMSITTNNNLTTLIRLNNTIQDNIY